MTDELAFLRAIAMAPDDDAPRLVFADWLEERGDPRAAFVRRELEWHRRPARPDDPLLVDLASRLDGRWVERFRQLRPPAPGVRRDLAVVADGKGLLDVRGGEPETTLLVDGRPVVLTAAAEGTWCEFVIDGHHKLLAYGRQKVQPAILSIVRWDAPETGAGSWLGLFPRGHRGVAEYRRMRRRMSR